MVNPFTKDFKGGILVKKVTSKSNFLEGDVIIVVDGKRVENSLDLFNDIYTRPSVLPVQSPTVKVKVIRAQKIKKITAHLRDITQNILIENAAFVKVACSLMTDDEEKPLLCDTNARVWIKKFLPPIQKKDN